MPAAVPGLHPPFALLGSASLSLRGSLLTASHPLQPAAAGYGPPLTATASFASLTSGGHAGNLLVNQQPQSETGGGINKPNPTRDAIATAKPGQRPGCWLSTGELTAERRRGVPNPTQPPATPHRV